MFLNSEFTMVFAPDAHPNSWKLLDMLIKPTFSMIRLWGITENVGFTNNFHEQFP